jgi:hypothetical protein
MIHLVDQLVAVELCILLYLCRGLTVPLSLIFSFYNHIFLKIVLDFILYNPNYLINIVSLGLFHGWWIIEEDLVFWVLQSLLLG